MKRSHRIRPSRFDRRDFLKVASATGLALTVPGAAFGQVSNVPEDDGSGPYWLFVHAGGGWDPTMVCDPKGQINEEQLDPVNHFPVDDIMEIGAFKVAPVGYNREFFEKHQNRTLVLNGVDTQTNNHDAGTRHTWSGKLTEGYPSLAALIASDVAATRPMAFVSNGGYDFTGGLVAPTRTGNIGAINRIAFPNSINGDPNATFHTEGTVERIMDAQTRRRGFLNRTFNLPRPQQAISQLFTARVGQNEVKRLSEYLPDEFNGAPLARQSQVAMAAFRAGISRCANLSIGGFDTHGNHDAAQGARLDELIRGVDFAWDEAERQGIADDLIVVVGSDFARTPGYNDGEGKDHWSITSMILMGRGVPGNKVIGASDERQRPLEVNPDTLQVVESGGTRLHPEHVHVALRKAAGVYDGDAARSLFPLIGALDLNLLG